MESPGPVEQLPMDSSDRNRALSWLTLCYPTMPPAFIAAFYVCLGKPELLPVLVAYYALLLFALGLCVRWTGPARWAFGMALVVCLLHLYLAVDFVGHRLHAFDTVVPPLLEDLLMPTVDGVAFFVGLGCAHLAYSHRRRGLAVGLLTTSALHAFDGMHRESPMDDPRFFLLIFTLQAVMVWRTRETALPPEGMGLNPLGS